MYSDKANSLFLEKPVVSFNIPMLWKSFINLTIAATPTSKCCKVLLIDTIGLENKNNNNFCAGFALLPSVMISSS